MNRTLSIFANHIPYYKALRPLANSVTASILLSQLEFRFDKYTDGFYKFLEECENPAYRKGDSWVEELGFSAAEFRTAFAKIGVAHKSVTSYKSAKKKGDIFVSKGEEKYYCSVRDRTKGLTHYYRNHAFIDAKIEALCGQSTSKPKKEGKLSSTNDSDDSVPPLSTQINDVEFRKSTTLIYGNEDSSFTLNTNNTPKITTEITHTSGSRTKDSKKAIASESEQNVCVKEVKAKSKAQDSTALETEPEAIAVRAEVIPPHPSTEEAQYTGWDSEGKLAGGDAKPNFKKRSGGIGGLMVAEPVGKYAEFYRSYNEQKPESWDIAIQTRYLDAYLERLDVETRGEGLKHLCLALGFMRLFPKYYADGQHQNTTLEYLIKPRDGCIKCISLAHKGHAKGINPDAIAQSNLSDAQIAQGNAEQKAAPAIAMMQKMEARRQAIAERHAAELARADELDRAKKLGANQ